MDGSLRNDSVCVFIVHEKFWKHLFFHPTISEFRKLQKKLIFFAKFHMSKCGNLSSKCVLNKIYVIIHRKRVRMCLLVYFQQLHMLLFKVANDFVDMSEFTKISSISPGGMFWVCVRYFCTLILEDTKKLTV